jgi:RNA polymerase sigma-70 factor (ECF subfamily)
MMGAQVMMVEELTGPAEAYSRYFSMVWRSLRRLGVPESAVEDALQDVFVVVHQRWADFRGESSRKTWIFGILLRVASRYRRQARRQGAQIDVDLLGVLPEPADRAGPLQADPLETASRNEAARLVNAILEQFDDDHRTLFVLVEIEQLSVKEAAELVGANPSTCYKRLEVARRMFESASERLRARDQWRLR